MSNLSDEFIALTCPNCGGKVELDKATVDEHFVETPNGFVYMGSIQDSQTATCKHCNTQFVKKASFAPYSGGGMIQAGRDVHISGDQVGRDKNVTTVTHIGGPVEGPVLSGEFNAPINVGDITGSIGVAVGHGAQVNVGTGSDLVISGMRTSDLDARGKNVIMTGGVMTGNIRNCDTFTLARGVFTGDLWARNFVHASGQFTGTWHKV